MVAPGLVRGVPVDPENLTTTSFPIVGMHCAACVTRVEKALAAMPGVVEAAANFATERALVRYDAQQVSEGDLGRFQFG